MPSASPSPRRLIILGSTGSIGTSTLAVVDHLREQNLAHFQIVGLAAGSNAEALAAQADRYNVEHVALADAAHASRIVARHRYLGVASALEMVSAIARPGDLVMGAMVGSAGIPATLAAIERGCDIALANKETLVAAGAIVMPRVKAAGVHLLPVDSEHSAIFQCLLAGRSIEEVRRLVITASGGPLRTWPRARVHAATVEEALNHPTWDMGPKVTIDSASLMNKALEVIEAHWLFGLPADKIEVIVHPQSIVHSFVEFVDGSVVAQLGPPDMKTPIQYALTWPHRIEGCSRRMEWSSLRNLAFEPLDHDTFPAVRLAYDVIARGGSAGAIFNAADETAVHAFINHHIPFGMITTLVADALRELPLTPVDTLDDVLRADQAARAFINSRLPREAVNV